MAEITAAQVKELRERTGAGMMDCKKALVENNGDIEASIDWLRKKGLAAAAKKAGRIAAEGLVGVATRATGNGYEGVVVEVNAETDFVARNELFQNFTRTILDIIYKTGSDIEALKAHQYPNSSKTVEEELTNLIAVIGEHMSIRRAQHIKVENGAISGYVHNSVAPFLGKKGVLVGLNSTGSKEELLDFAKKLAMHIAATSPIAKKTEEVSQEKIQKEKDVFIEQLKLQGFEGEALEKKVERKVRQFFEEFVLMNQNHVIEGGKKVEHLIGKLSEKLGTPVEVSDFVHYTLGEGIEKASADFAAEVAAVAKG